MAHKKTIIAKEGIEGIERRLKATREAIKGKRGKQDLVQTYQQIRNYIAFVDYLLKRLRYERQKNASLRCVIGHVADELYPIYNESVDQTKPEFYAAILGCHEMLESALSECKIETLYGHEAKPEECRNFPLRDNQCLQRREMFRGQGSCLQEAG